VYQGKDPYPSRYSENLRHHSRTPPSIIYAPGSHSKGHYAPPTMIHHPHGAPAPRFPHAGGPLFPPSQNHLESVNDNTKSRSRRASRTRGYTSRSPSPSSLNSGSTYYVLPTAGQKVQIIVSIMHNMPSILWF
jgi:hypothetical protein